MSDSYEDRLKAIRSNIERIVSEHGHAVQYVADGENSFAYTIGRNDKGLPDFYIDGCAQQYLSIIKEVIDGYNSLKLDCVLESENLVWKYDETHSVKTKFKLQEIDIETVKDKVLGIYNRYNRPEQVQLIQIHIADKDNVV